MTTRTRILLAIAYPLGVAIVSLAIPLALNVRDRVEAEVRDDAATQAALIAAMSAEHDEPSEGVDLQQLADKSAAAAQGRVVIVDRHGRLLADSSGVAEVGTVFTSRPEIKSALAGRRTQIQRHSRALDQNLLATAVPILHAGKPDGAVRITQSMVSVTSATRRAALGIAVLAGIVLIVGLIGAVALATQLSRSSRRLHDAALRVSDGELDTTVPVEGSSDQRELATAFNTMTDRVGRLLRSQEALVADASHQLRTPLTGTRLQVEELLHVQDLDEVPALAITALDELDRLGRTVDELIVLSSDGGADPLRLEVDLGEVAALAAQRWNGPASEHGQILKLHIEDAAVVSVSDEDVTRALDALVENAVAYSPRKSCITIAVRDTQITVLDEGPGIAPGEEDVVFDRFRRGRAAGKAPGSGLGLAIARQLARRNGGEVTISNRSDRGGARAVLEVVASDA